MALGLSEPWTVSKIEFIDGEHSAKELHIWLSFPRGHRFKVGEAEATAYDTIDKTWRHLNPKCSFLILVDYLLVLSLDKVDSVKH